MPAKILAASASPKKSSSTSLKTKPIQKPASINYALYLHREELRKRRISKARVSRTKFLLTHELINKTVRNINNCTAEDLQYLNRQAIFKKNLYRQLVQQKSTPNTEAQRMQQQQAEQQRHLQQQRKQLSSVQKSNRLTGKPTIQRTHGQQQKMHPLLQRQNSMQFIKF